MKASSGFKMDKETKRVAATIIDRTKRAEYKNHMIAAQLSFEKAKRESFKQKRNDTSGDE